MFSSKTLKIIGGVLKVKQIFLFLSGIIVVMNEKSGDISN